MSTFKNQFIKWKTDNDQHGPLALTRFVMLFFIEGLQVAAPDRYVFKGGNLLWHYIKTPRSTVDIDFATEENIEINQVISDFNNIKISDCEFVIKSSRLIQSNNKTGAAIHIEFKTIDGSTNLFGVDVVFAIKTHSQKIKLSKSTVTAASIENILVDKIAACHKFGGGNTRMKDFDDLFRIKESDLKINPTTLILLASTNQTALSLDKKWINPSLQSAWDEYVGKKTYKRSKDLPADLNQVFDIINDYLSDIIIIAK